MDRHSWYYRYKVDTDWLENFIEDIERTDRDLVTALTDSTGVGSGFNVTERGAGQNFSVDISAGVAYDPSGKRIYSSDTQNLPFVEDEAGNPITVAGSGNARIVSIYAAYALVDEPSSAVVDGFGDTVYTIQTESVSFKLYQGTEATSGTEVALADPGDDMVRLADVTIRYSDNTIANADIDESVKEYLTLTLASDEVGFDEIDWGTGTNQVDGTETTHWIISKTATNELTLDHAVLTADRTWTFPDASSTVLGTDSTQNVSNKTYIGIVATGNATFDTGTLFVDATNNRVGIKTTSPTNRLDIRASSGMGLAVANEDDSNRGLSIIVTGTAGSGTSAVNSTSGGYALTFGIDSIEKARIATDGTFIIGGVGTSIDATNLLQVYKSSSGANVNSLTRNTSNTSGSNANVVASVAGTSGGDPAVLLDITGATGWYLGVDNSDSDTFQIGTGSAVGTNVAMAINTSGDAAFVRDLLVTRNITVFGSILSPTITTPTIASFANANHNHQDSAGGGALSTSAITSGTFADARIASSNVTQHQTSLTIAETQITDGSVLARVGSNETISGTWTFSNEITLPTQDPPASMSTVNKNSTVKGFGKCSVTGASSGTFSQSYNIDSVTVSSYELDIVIDTNLTSSAVVVANGDGAYNVYGSSSTSNISLNSYDLSTGAARSNTWSGEFVLLGN